MSVLTSNSQMVANSCIRLKSVQYSSKDKVAKVDDIQKAESSRHIEMTAHFDHLLSSSARCAEDLAARTNEILSVTNISQLDRVQAIETNLISHFVKRDATLLRKISLAQNDSVTSHRIRILLKKHNIRSRKKPTARSPLVGELNHDATINCSEQMAGSFRSLVEGIYFLAAYIGDSLRSMLSEDRILAIL